ncbi:MAG: hypothetical protein ACOX2R_09730 [Anaerolineae bacterium]|jgi:hypothetical protein
MRHKGSVYVGTMLVLLGIFFALAQNGGALVRLVTRFDSGWGAFWPLIIVLAGVAFLLPILVWWERRKELAGMAVPGIILLVNGLMLQVQNLTGWWHSWAYTWALEPVAVGLGLLAMYFLGHRSDGLLVAASIVGGSGLLFFMIFASAFGGIFRWVGPLALIGVGALVILRGVAQQSDRDD